MRPFRLTGLALLLATATGVYAQDDHQVQKQGLTIGGRAPVSGVYFASGEWAKHSKMTCPAAAKGQEPKVAIYTTVLNDQVMNLALAIDGWIAADESLKWSFVSMSDEAVVGPGVDAGTASDIVAKRLREIKQAATAAGIERLTFGLTRAGASAEREKVGLADDRELVVAFLDQVDGSSRRVRFAQQMNSEDLTEEAIESLLDELKALHD